MTLKSIIAAVTISVIPQFCVAMDAMESQALPNKNYLAVVMECPLKKRIEMRQVSKLTRDAVDKIHEGGKYLEELAFEIAIRKNIYMEISRGLNPEPYEDKVFVSEYELAFVLPNSIDQLRDWCSMGYEFKWLERSSFRNEGYLTQYYSFWLFHYGVVHNCLPLVRYALDQHNNFINPQKQLYLEGITIPLTCASFNQQISKCKYIINERYNRKDALLDINNNDLLRNILSVALEDLEKLAEDYLENPNDPLEDFMGNLSIKIIERLGKNLFIYDHLNESLLDVYKNRTCEFPTHLAYLVEKNFVDIFDFVIRNETFRKFSFGESLFLGGNHSIKMINLGCIFKSLFQKGNEKSVEFLSKDKYILKELTTFLLNNKDVLGALKTKSEEGLDAFVKKAQELNRPQDFLDILTQVIEKVKQMKIEVNEKD